jgi:prepilin-type processing-associated H-X9-DG protein
LLELLAVMSVLTVAVFVLAPALARTKPAGKSIGCLNNLRRFAAAWSMYSADQLDRVANNFGVAGTMDAIGSRTYDNWANNVMDWTTAPMNTNNDLLRVGVMGPYLGGDFGVYRCPADGYRSTIQRAAGLAFRTRSISMNSVLGRFSHTTDSTSQGLNWALPQYIQYLKQTRIPKPARTWVVLDEHPDSINDGYFLNSPSGTSWQDIPASYHNGGCGFSFADGHCEIRKWLSAASRYPTQFIYPPTKVFDAPGRLDFAWYLQRTGYVDARTGKPAFGY